MSQKALLHGGFRGLTSKEAKQAWEAYFQEMLKGAEAFFASDALTIVLVPWANSPKQWVNIARKLAERCQEYWPNKTVSILTAEDAPQLLEYSKTADLLYCPGGIMLQKVIEPMQGVAAELLQSNIKVFTGFSAGAYALASTYYDANKKAALPGGGLFNGAVCCHYDEKRAVAKGLLHEAEKQNPHLLTDGDFVWLRPKG